MCDPASALLATTIAASAGSAGANHMSQNSINDARNSVLMAENARQSALDDEAFKLVENTQDSYRNFGEQQAQKAQNIGDFLGDLNKQAPASIVPASTSNITVKEEAKQSDKAQAEISRNAQALGNLRSFGDVLGDLNVGQARNASLIGQLGGFKAGSSNVVPLELETANQAGDGWGTFADILQGVSDTAGTAAFGGYGGFGQGSSKPFDLRPDRYKKSPSFLASLFGG